MKPTSAAKNTARSVCRFGANGQSRNVCRKTPPIYCAEPGSVCGRCPGPVTAHGHLAVGACKPQSRKAFRFLFFMQGVEPARAAKNKARCVCTLRQGWHSRNVCRKPLSIAHRTWLALRVLPGPPRPAHGHPWRGAHNIGCKPKSQKAFRFFVFVFIVFTMHQVLQIVFLQ